MQINFHLNKKEYNGFFQFDKVHEIRESGDEYNKDKSHFLFKIEITECPM